MLSFRAVFISGLLLNFVAADCHKWLPSEKLFNFYSFPVSLSQVYFVWFLPQPMTTHESDIRNGYGPDCQVSANRPSNNWA